MTVVAWDGRTLAADKQVTQAGMRLPITKLWRGKNGEGLAITGDLPRGLILKKWYEDGADLEKYPKVNDCDEWSRLIVATASGLIYYERLPVALSNDAKFMAFGSGRNYAMAAMKVGASARRAVEVASEFDDGCGLGVDAVDVLPLPALTAVGEYAMRGQVGSVF